MTRVGELSTYFIPEEAKAPYEHRAYPHPYSSRDDDIATLHNGRVGYCISRCMCIVCGLKVETDTDGRVWIYRNSQGGLVEDSGPFHEKCMRLTISMCPVIKFRNFSWELAVWDDVGPLIRGAHDFNRT